MKRLFFLVWIALCAGVGFASSLQDPAWVSGELENGLRYFIRQNSEPRGRLELRLVVNAGSILEDEDQQGLAHYLEHMAFNGTEHFEKDALVAFLESLGVAFGPDLNAYTSFDETVYQLRLPTEDPEVVDKAFLVLSDWAGGILAEDEAIAAERGVIIEEWRGGRGADSRVRDRQYPLLFKNSRYAERLPIGKLEVLESFDFQRLRDFYQDWYRPGLMSVIAVGDLDVEETRSRIEEMFSDLEGPEDPRPREDYRHPPAEERRAGVFTDPELTGAEINLVWNHPPQTIQTQEAFLVVEKEALVSDMLNQRFAEISKLSDAPFLGAAAYAGGFTRAGKVFFVGASVKDEPGAVMEGGSALMEELERARRFGFTPGELERAVARRLSAAEQAVAEKDTTNSAVLARELVRHALEGEIVPGPERELELLQAALPEMTTGEASAILADWTSPQNLVIMAQGPERADGNFMPSEAELLTLPQSLEDKELLPYEDGLGNAELVAAPPEAGEIVGRSEREDVGLISWELSNGMRVLLKPTEFKRDEILVRAWSPGGMNLASEADWVAAKTAGMIAGETGLGEFSSTELQKLLAGRRVMMSAFIEMDQQGITAQSSPKDLETLMQLIHLRFTTIRRDDEAFAALRNRLRESIRNRDSDPKQVYEDIFSGTLSNYHPRLLPMTLEEVEAMDQEASLAFFAQRFRHAGAFTVFIVGAFDPEALEPLVTTWLASLPSGGPAEEAAFLHTDFPKYSLERRVSQGLDPVGEVRMVWTSEDFTWDYASRHAVQSMAAALRIRLREEVREEKGGTYHVSVIPRLTHYPTPRQQLIIRFGCDPERVDELIAEVQGVVDRLQSDLLEERYVEIVRQTQLRRRETDLRENSYWAYVIPFYEWHGEDPSIILEFEEFVAGITAESIRDAARDVFSTPHVSTFVLLPEEKTDEPME